MSMAANTGVYPFTEQRPSYHTSPYYEVLGAVAASLAAIALLAKLLHLWLRSRKDALEAERRRLRLAGVGNGYGVGAPRQQPPVPASVAVEMAQAMGPLVCTYLKADGWPAEAACAVCLAELADGEAVRVLPVCMHYFHTACVSEWLRTHRICPLCRAPLAPPAAADEAAAAASDAAAA